MSQSYGPVYIHVVFGTRNRKPLLTPQLHTELARYITPILKDCGSRLVTEGGMPDHVHLLIDLGRESSVSDLVREIKTKSSKWLVRKCGSEFGWQSGYGVFSISVSLLPKVEGYIQNQERHHRAKSFQEEYVEMLEAAGVKYDPKYLWRESSE
jgi:putative transposase